MIIKATQPVYSDYASDTDYQSNTRREACNQAPGFFYITHARLVWK